MNYMELQSLAKTASTLDNHFLFPSATAKTLVLFYIGQRPKAQMLASND
jgi:hypothetical protein